MGSLLVGIKILLIFEIISTSMFLNECGVHLSAVFVSLIFRLKHQLFKSFVLLKRQVYPLSAEASHSSLSLSLILSFTLSRGLKTTET